MVLTDEQQQRVEYIQQKCKSFENQAAKLEGYLKGESPDPVNARLRLDSLAVLYKEYLKYQDELVRLSPQDPQLNAFLEIESRYFEVASGVNKIQTVEPLGHSTLNTGSLVITEHHTQPRLPQIKLPTFDGKRENWTNFKAKFVTLVHDRLDLNDTVKASQLFSAVTDKALAKIAHYDPSGDDYSKAWKSLLDFYDQKRIVAVQHLNALLDLPKLSKATAEGLSSLMDNTRQHLHILEHLGTNHSEDLVVRIIERCLPPAVSSRWQDQLAVNELSKLENLFKFIQKTIFKLQALDESSDRIGNPDSRKRAGEVVYQTPSKVGKQVGRSFVTSGSSTTNPDSIACPHCKQGHRLFKCPAFNKFSIQERWQFVTANKVCRNCLWVHPHSCKSERRCKKCNKFHHTLLHQDKGSGSQNPKNQESKSKDEDSASSSPQQ